MRIRFALILLTVGCLSSCLHEEIIDVAQPDKTDIFSSGKDWIQSRVGDNVLAVTANGMSSTQIDWSADWEKEMENFILQTGGADIYAYNGEGGEFSWSGNTLSLHYKQGQDWRNSGFKYMASTQKKEMEDTKHMKFKDAFGFLQFRITNKEKAFHLQIADITLCKVSTTGTFVFPSVNDSAYWITDEPSGLLFAEQDTIDIGGEKSELFFMDNPLPVIPQKTKAWNATSLPVFSQGSYLLLNCRIFNVSNVDIGYQENVDTAFWCNEDGEFADIAIPISLDIEIGKSYIVDLIFESNSPWYICQNGDVGKLLQPITFAPEVDNWENGSSINMDCE